MKHQTDNSVLVAPFAGEIEVWEESLRRQRKLYFINYKKHFLLHLLKMCPCCNMVVCAVVVIVSVHNGRTGIYWFEWKSQIMLGIEMFDPVGF